MALDEQRRVPLPEEIIYHIASCIGDVGDLCNAAAVSRQWQRACTSHIERHLRDVVPRDPRELELQIIKATNFGLGKLSHNPDKWADVNWRALGLRYSAREDAMARNWREGNVATRWVPHVFERDNLSISAACPHNGEVFCTKDYIWDQLSTYDEDGHERKFKTFSFDNSLIPTPGTRSGTFFPSKFPDGAHWGCANVPGMGPVLLFAPEVPEFHEPDQPHPHDTEGNVVEIWVTREDRDRWKGLDCLDSTIQPPRRAENPIPDATWGHQEWHYLATIPFRIDMCEEIPPLDRVLALHVDYDREGPRSLVAAHSHLGKAVVRHVAEASRVLDAQGKPMLANTDNLVTIYEHGLMGDIYMDGWEELLCYTYIDNNYVFAVENSAISVWSRAMGEHVVTIYSNLVHCGPFFDLDAPVLQEQCREVQRTVLKRQSELVPSATTAVRHFNIECVLSDDSRYSDLVYSDTPADEFLMGPNTLVLAGGNLMLWTDGRWLVLVDYHSVFQRALELPRDEEQPQFYQAPDGEDEDNRPPPPVDPRLQEVVAPCLMTFGLDRGDEGPVCRIYAFKDRMLYATEQTTYMLDLSRITRLPAAEPFHIPVLELIGVGRNLRTGGYHNKRFLMTDSSVFEVVALTESQELGSMGNGYLEATQGFPKNVRWRHDWSWPPEPGAELACAIRVLSAEPHDMFAGAPHRGVSFDGWGAYQESNYVIDSKTGGILEEDMGDEGPDGWGQAALKTRARHARLAAAQGSKPKEEDLV